MDKPRVILGATLIALAGGIGLFASQRVISIGPPHQPAGTHSGMSMFAMHHDCATSQESKAAAKSHVPEHFAKALELTSSQLADIDRLSAELCQTITKAHDAMMNTLTSDQREKLAKLHEGDHAGGIHAWMKKLHGGGR